MKVALVIAHRGASILAPENTLAAISLAVEMGADMVECDLRRTVDGRIVLHHNADVAGKPLKYLTYGDVRSLAENKDAEIPLLKDALHLIRGRAAIDLELKEAGYEKEILKTVTAVLPKEQFVMTSFLKRPLETIKRIDPEVRTGLIQKKKRVRFSPRQRTRVPRRLHWCETFSIDWYLPHFELVNDELLDTAFAKNIPVVVWTVNDRTDMESYFKDFRIYGICTDRPDLALACRSRSGRTGKSDSESTIRLPRRT